MFTIHSTEYGRSGNHFENGQSVRVRFQERAGIDWADRVIAVSTPFKNEVMWVYDVPDWKLAVVHNGVNVHNY